MDHRQPQSAAPHAMPTPADHTIVPGPEPLPMFPSDEHIDYGGSGVSGIQGTVPFGILDPFAVDWAMLTDDVFNNPTQLEN